MIADRSHDPCMIGPWVLRAHACMITHAWIACRTRWGHRHHACISCIAWPRGRRRCASSAFMCMLCAMHHHQPDCHATAVTRSPMVGMDLFLPNSVDLFFLAGRLQREGGRVIFWPNDDFYHSHAIIFTTFLFLFLTFSFTTMFLRQN